MSHAAHIIDVEKSQTLLINEQSRLKEAGGSKVYKFGFGQSPFFPPAHVVDELKKNARRKEYGPVQGNNDVREAVAAFHNALDGLNIDPENIFIAPGSKQLLYTVMAAFKNVNVLIPAPAWVSYEPQAHLLGHKAIRVETGYDKKWHVTPDALEAAIAQGTPDVPCLLILNYPSNPEGLSYSPAELEALTATLRAHNVVVMSDEIYGLLHHEGQHVSLARYYPEGTIVTTGLSKWCGAGGWRFGAALLPDALATDMKEAMLGIASETYSCAPIPVQAAAVAAYQWNDANKAFVEGQRAILKALGNEVQQRLVKAGCKVHAPEGAFYLFVDFSNFGEKALKLGATTANDFCVELLKATGAALLSGEAFGIDANHLCARLAYVEFDGDAALEAVYCGEAVDAAFLDKYCGKTLEGIDAMCAWLQG